MELDMGMSAMGLAKGEPLAALAMCLGPPAVIGFIALAPVCIHFPRFSHRGRACLKQIG